MKKFILTAFVLLLCSGCAVGGYTYKDYAYTIDPEPHYTIRNSYVDYKDSSATNFCFNEECNRYNIIQESRRMPREQSYIVLQNLYVDGAFVQCEGYDAEKCAKVYEEKGYVRLNEKPLAAGWRSSPQNAGYKGRWWRKGDEVPRW